MALERKAEIRPPIASKRDLESFGLSLGAAKLATANEALRAGMLIGSKGLEQHSQYVDYVHRIRALNKRLAEHCSGWHLTTEFPQFGCTKTTAVAESDGVFEHLFDHLNPRNAAEELGDRLKELECAVGQFCVQYAQFKQEQSTWHWDESRQTYCSWFPQGNCWICEDGTKIPA